MTSRARLWWSAGLCLLSAACASSPGQQPVDAGDEGLVSCENDPRVRPYAPGMVAHGVNGALQFRLLASDPSPPGKGNNVFTFEVVDEDGGAAFAATLRTNLNMPDHGHPTPVLPIVHYGAQRYTLDPVYMFMPGVWRLEVSAYPSDSDAGPPLDSAVLFFCVEG